MSRTAVVILNFNGEKLLREFLPSVIRYTTNAEVIVADNGSSDGSVQVLRAEFPTVRIITLDRNYGFCGGYNRSLGQVDADYFVLLNSDVQVTAGWLEPMITMLDRETNIGAVQPKILSYHDRSLFEYAGAAGGFHDPRARGVQAGGGGVGARRQHPGAAGGGAGGSAKGGARRGVAETGAKGDDRKIIVFHRPCSWVPASAGMTD